MPTSEQVITSVPDGLEMAASVIETHGWHQRDWFTASEDHRPKVDALGAINVAYGREPDAICHVEGGLVYAAFLALAAHVDSIVADARYAGEIVDFQRIVDAISVWNDRPRRASEEVVRTLRYVADLERRSDG